jgi:hypothetical protein
MLAERRARVLPLRLKRSDRNDWEAHMSLARAVCTLLPEKILRPYFSFLASLSTSATGARIL